jgi:RNA polymerase sigma factor (sigma-70 family)
VADRDIALLDPQHVIGLRPHRHHSEGLSRIAERLPEREAMVMSLHYQEGLTFREVAKVLDLTPGRISQIHTQAILRLRALAKESDFRS